MISLILKYLSDSLLSAVFGFIEKELQRRSDIAQGRAQQHTADLEATVKDAADASAIEENVRKLSDAQLDAGLERVRDAAGKQ